MRWLASLGLLLALLPLTAPSASAELPSRSERSAILDEIERMEVELMRADEQLHAATVRHRQLEGRIAELEQRLSASEERLVERKERLALRLRVMYRMRQRGFLPLMFSAESPHELLRNARYLWWVVRSDQEALDSWTADLAEHDHLKETVVGERDELQQWAGEVSLRRAETLGLREERQALLGRVRSRSDRRRMETLLVERRAEQLDVQLDLRSEATPELSVETVEPTSTFEVSRGRLPMPAIGAVESSGHGVVIKAQAGSAIKAVHGGRVSKVLHVSGYGLVCILSHGGEWHTVYGHASAFSVRAGQNVESGEVIGSVGDSGSLDGPRLHFEVRQDRSPEDPLEWLNVPPGLAPSSR